jgi:oligogalacturonide lyase
MSADAIHIRPALNLSPRRITAGGAGHDQLLYFTSSSLLADDRRLVVISERTGHPNLFLRDLASGVERQLTHNTNGALKSYVYFNGNPYRGFGKASVSLHAASGTVYYIQGREIRCVDADGRARTLAEYPAGQMTAFTHVSADGSRLCVPTVDARALDDERPLGMPRPDYDIDERVRREHLNSWLRVYDTATGAELRCERVPEAWITHVQFSPRDREQILYNHEWPSDCGIRRI